MSRSGVSVVSNVADGDRNGSGPEKPCPVPSSTQRRRCACRSAAPAGSMPSSKSCPAASSDAKPALRDADGLRLSKVNLPSGPAATMNIGSGKPSKMARDRASLAVSAAVRSRTRSSSPAARSRTASCRPRARRADRAALTRLSAFNGRSSSTGLPRPSKTAVRAALLVPGCLVASTRKARSDQGGWAATASSSAGRSGPASDSSVTTTQLHPGRARMMAGKSAHTSIAMKEARSTRSITGASRPRGASTRTGCMT